MTIELTQEEVKLIIVGLFMAWKTTKHQKTANEASLLSGKLQQLLKKEKESKL